MSTLTATLQRLRAQAGVQPPAASPTATHAATLQRLLAQRPAASRAATSRDRHVPGEEIAPGLYRIDAQIAVEESVPQMLAFDRAAFAAVPTSALLHFDTETTGLAGGTGTRAFMIGVADWHAGALRVRQLLITTLAAEAAMLRTFLGWLQPEHTLVSYNGRSYDAPLLKTRCRLARLAHPLAEIAHLDLLHPVRRRYRGVWENCRLATIERQLLQVLREDDLPGAEAPRAFIEYLRGGSARDLRRVVAHNRQDLVSLARLAVRMGDREGGPWPAVDAVAGQGPPP